MARQRSGLLAGALGSCFRAVAARLGPRLLGSWTVGVHTPRDVGIGILCTGTCIAGRAADCAEPTRHEPQGRVGRDEAGSAVGISPGSFASGELFAVLQPEFD